MENSVQALLIAAGVLIGILILSLGISLYTSLSGFVDNSEQEIISKEIQEFNEKFIKYINCETIAEEPQFTLTIQDVVTAANTAHENNIRYNLDKYENNNFYVTIKLNNQPLEKNINSKMAELLENGLGEEYKCSRENVKINPETGRVYEVKFNK